MNYSYELFVRIIRTNNSSVHVEAIRVCDLVPSVEMPPSVKYTDFVVSERPISPRLFCHAGPSSNVPSRCMPPIVLGRII